MQSMQRQFGKLMSKSPGDNAKVSVILNDYEDADQVLAKIIDNTKTLRDAWVSAATTQWGIVKEYEGLYDPIVGATDGHGRKSVATPELQLQRTFRLQEAYLELKNELAEEIIAIDTHILKPATDARDYIQPIRKTIKKRENKRLDYEKCEDKVKKLQKKGNKTAKEDAQLAKATDEMARTAEEFQIADAHLRETLPPIVAAAFELIKPLLAIHITIQNRLLALYYTVLHNYCEENNFPSPPPPMEEVTSEWHSLYKPIQREVESISCIAHGKAIRQSMSLPDDGQARKPSMSSAPSRNTFSRTPSGLIPSARDASGVPSPRPMRIPSSNSLHQPIPSDSSPKISPRASSTNLRLTKSNILAPTDFTTATALGRARTPDQPSPGTGSDYFGRDTSTVQSSQGFVVPKKRPPPPPPPKRIHPPDEFVVALYDFPGGSSGDLCFREGDKIKIVKKTDTDQDWWVGELGGLRGNFPANYCRAA